MLITCHKFLQIYFITTISNNLPHSVCFLNNIVYFCTMNKQIEILKGLHPGAFLQRELKRRKLKSGHFAESVGEHPQTLSAIIRGRRSMNIPLSFRIEQALGLEEGFLMTLQLHYDIAEEKQRLANSSRPDTTKFRPALFWDTTMKRIDFTAHKRYVINRVFERGTEDEILEIIRFDGKETILGTIDHSPSSPFADNIKNNIKAYLDYEA